MSLASWKKEFYPTAAGSKAAKAAPAAHSLQKWLGLLPANLKKHGVVQWRGDVMNAEAFSDWQGSGGVYYNMPPSFEFSGTTCSLCAKYMTSRSYDGACSACPLYTLLDRRTCEEEDADGRPGPFSQLIFNNKPDPMIKLLKKLAKKEAKK